MQYSDLQKNVFESVEKETSNLLISAVAGSGKTTTIIKSLDYLKGGQDITFLAFNKSIVSSLESRVSKNINVSTFHSLGYKTLLQNGIKFKIEENKVKRIIYENLKRFKINKKDEGSYVFTMNKIIDFMRLNNCETDEELFDLLDKHEILYTSDTIIQAKEILRISNNQESIDFVDMLYLPIHLDLKVKKQDVVFIDESQDLSMIQQALFKRLLKKKSRFIAVGDNNQSIYGFAGADVDSYDKLKNSPNVKELPLSICYRCSKSIVKLAQTIVPEIQYFDKSDVGIVRNASVKEITHGDWVLCRNTKPLTILFLQLFKQKKKVSIKGIDFGNDLLELLRPLESDNLIVAKIKLNKELEKKYDYLYKMGVKEPEKTSYYRKMLERIDVLTDVIFKEVKSISAAKSLIVEMFNEKVGENKVTLSTIHKSKGFENDRVFVLRKDLMPSKFSVLDWELQQEKHLEYVCYTRAKKELLFITDFRE